MKKLFLLLVLTISCHLNIVAQTTQPGHVVEYKGKAPKTPLKRAVQINVKGAGSTMSNATTGEFTLTFPNLKGGQLVFVNKPRAMGYELMNTREIDSWNINPNRSFNLVFCDKAQFDELCMKYYDISMKSYEDKLNKAKAMLDKALKAKEIQQQEYDEQTKQLEEDFAAKIANIDTYVDQFARIDLSEVSEKEQQILALVDEGKIDEAIAEYEKLDATSKLVEANKNISKLNEAQAKIQETLNSQIAERDSILAIFHREINLLYLAGGEENINKIGDMLYERVMSDTLNVSAIFEFCDFLEEQNAIGELPGFYIVADSASVRTHDYLGHLCANIKMAKLFSEKMINEDFNPKVYLNRAEADIEVLNRKNIDIPDDVMLNFYQTYYLYSSNITNNIEEQKKYTTKALELALKMYSIDPKEFILVSDSYKFMGFACLSDGDTLSCIKHLLKAVDIINEHAPFEKSIKKAHLADLYEYITGCYNRLDSLDKGLEYQLKAHAIYEELYKKNPGAYSLSYGYSYLALTNIYYYKDELDEVSKCENKALEILRKGFAEKVYLHSYEEAACLVYQNRGIRHIYEENYDEALVAWKEVLKINPNYLEFCQDNDYIPELYTILKEKGLVK